jgi:hypothetical protein
MKNILIFSILLFSCSSNKSLVKSSDTKDECSLLISKRIDDFNKDTIYSTPYLFKSKGLPKMPSNVDLSCFKSKERKSYYMSVLAYHSSPKVDMEDVQLLFEDGFILKKKCKINANYNSSYNLFNHTGIFSLDENELLRMKNSLITKFKVGHLERLLSTDEGERFKKLADCMMKI